MVVVLEFLSNIRWWSLSRQRQYMHIARLIKPAKVDQTMSIKNACNNIYTKADRKENVSNEIHLEPSKSTLNTNLNPYAFDLLV